MIEGGGTRKHLIHVRDLTDFPVANGMVEGNGIPEHPTHVRDLADIPLTDGMIEGGGVLKHPVTVSTFQPPMGWSKVWASSNM